MAVLDRYWLAVWWPWLVVWVATVALSIAAIAVVMAERRRDRAPEGRDYGITRYLDNAGVMDLYLQFGGTYKAALRQQVEERTATQRRFSLSAALAWLGGNAESSVNRDVFRKYVTEDAEPITVIEIVMKVLADADNIVTVDLGRPGGQVTGGKALRRALALEDDPGGVTLRQLNTTFVSIRGTFRETDRRTAITTLEARYDELDPSPEKAHVQVNCKVTDLRGTMPTTGFSAICLGRVLDWDSETARLIVQPIAIFG